MKCRHQIGLGLVNPIQKLSQTTKMRTKFEWNKSELINNLCFMWTKRFACPPFCCNNKAHSWCSAGYLVFITRRSVCPCGVVRKAHSSCFVDPGFESRCVPIFFFYWISTKNYYFCSAFINKNCGKHFLNKRKEMMTNQTNAQ